MAFLFADAPQRVYWELTRACDLSCTHCRANAIPSRHAEELTTAEIFDTLDALAQGAAPHVILTGGDPLKRPDFFRSSRIRSGSGCPASSHPAPHRC